MNRRGFEFSFALIFSLIVGAVILFLAVFVVTRFISTSQLEETTKLATQLSIVLNPVETSVESGKYYSVALADETRIYNRCFSDGDFGKQEIRTSVQNGIGKNWPRPGEPATFYNKYLFSPSLLESKEFNFFVKPLNFPYKVADLIIAYSDHYCFVDAPNEVAGDVTSLGLKNINLTNSLSACPRKSVSVCFAGGRCNITVNVEAQTVTKGRETLFYQGPLLYAAIVSDVSLYECQVKRLLKRTLELALVYQAKSGFLSQRGCSTNLEGGLGNYIQELAKSSSSSLRDLALTADELERKNEALACKLF